MNDENIKLLFTVIAGLLGIVAFLWNLFGYLWSYIFSHLQVDLTIDKISPTDENRLNVTTIVENKGNVSKELHFAFLLVYPNSSDYYSALKEVAKFLGFKVADPTLVEILFFITSKKNSITNIAIGDKISIIGISYYHQTHFQVGNERVKYPVVLDKLNYLKNEAYNVTFSLISLHLFKSYLRYRSTTTLFNNQ